MSAEPFAEAVKVLERGWYTDAELAEWLNAPHPQFEGKSAIEMLAAGKKFDVLAAVMRLEDGVYL
jgi:uncharacterized protein (DUF2384 family)